MPRYVTPTFPCDRLKSIVAPCNVVTVKVPLLELMASITAAASNFPDTMWQESIPVRASLLSGSKRDSTVPSGTLAKGLLVGAKTVNKPSPLRVPARSAAVPAGTSVL